MRLTTRLTDDLSHLRSADFDALGDLAGAAGCYERIRQHESDGRWQTVYCVAEEAGTTFAAVPAYTRLGRSWPDQRYDPRRWSPTDVPDEMSVGQCMFVGGCADLRSSLHIGPRSPELARTVLVKLAERATERGQCLVFPYLFQPDRDMLAAATDQRIIWAPLGRESRFLDSGDPDRERRIGSRVRGVLRRDRRLIEAAGVRAMVRQWSEVEETAARLIADHNVLKGTPDHPEFASLRHELWSQCESVEVIVLTAATESVEGVLTAMIWRTELELYEVGIAGGERPERMAVYLDLLFHQPVAVARDRGLIGIRAGVDAETAKKSRGAVTYDLYGGILSAEDTRRLASG